MPGLKLLFRRTLATSAVTPSSIISPPPPLSSPSTIITHGRTRRRVFCVTTRLGAGEKGCACLRKLGVVSGAHVSKNILLICNNNNNNNPTNIISSNKRLYILSPLKYSSSSSSSSSSSPSFEERESKEGEEGTQTSSSSSSPSQKRGVGVADMGHQQQNGGVVVEKDYQKQNGTVSGKDQQREQEQCTKLMTLPTVLTLARVAAIPVFIATFYVNSQWGAAATSSIFIAAAVTDWLDGYLARKMSQGTAFGAFLDPVADKLMVAATLVLLCSRPPETGLFGNASWLFPVPAIAIIGREITMSAVREWAASQNTKLLQAVAVNNLGKWKTATQMTALTILVATRDNSLPGHGPLVMSGVALLYISAGLAVWSLVVYMRKIWKVLLR